MTQKLVFEQIGSGNSRFRLKTKLYTIEIQKNQAQCNWKVEIFDQKLKQNVHNQYSRVRFYKFFDALDNVRKFLNHPSELIVGANEYPKHTMKVKEFCKRNFVKFDDSPLSINVSHKLLGDFERLLEDSPIKEKDQCICSKEKFNFTSHMMYCPKHPKYHQ